MALVLNEEQRLLQSAAQEYFSSRLSTAEFRKARDADHLVKYSSDAWQEMIDLGWGSILLPESLDGLDFGLTGMGVICIEAAKSLAVTPLQSAATLCVEALLRCEASSVRDEMLRAIAEGKHVPTLIRRRYSKIESTRNDDGVTLNGSMQFVAEGSSADTLLVMIGAGETKTQLCLINAQDKGVERETVSLLDRRDYANITLNQIQVSSENILTFEKDGQDCVDHINDIGAVMTACELYGCSTEAFSRTLAHLCEREQFGQKLGAFQALQHRMAKAYMQLELLKSVLYDALDALENDRADSALAASHAKVMANDVAQLVCTEAIQLHGGMGITDELDIGLFYKRTRVLRTVFGSSAYHKNRFASLSGL